MCNERRSLTWILMLLFLGDIFCTTYEVDSEQHICAVKGSSVTINCSFNYPNTEEVQSVKWSNESSDKYNGPFIYDSDLNNNSSRFEYIGNKHQNCSFKIHQVEQNDTGKYTFRFITDSNKWTAERSSTLSIVDLIINETKRNEMAAIMEGDSVDLTCVNDCDGDERSSEFTWFRDGEPILDRSVLHLRNMSFTSSGNYSCSLKTHTGASSGVKHIDVEYGPKNTSVSVQPSAEVSTGSNVTLICSSRANPPVENYTWFKISDDNHILAVGQQPEQNLEEVSQGDGGQYFCRATNRHGSQNSSVTTLKIHVHWAALNRDVLIIIIATSAATLLTVTTLVAIRRLYKKGTVSPDSDSAVDVQNADYVNWPMSDASETQEGSQSDGGLVYATVNFNTRGKSDMVQQMDSPDDDECVTYTTVGRNQLLNPP